MIAAGGTAGHVVPALAVADALRAEGAEVAFIGGERAEAQLVPRGRLSRCTRSPSKACSRTQPAARAARARARRGWRCRARGRLLARMRPDAVMGGGGYVAGPVALAALTLRIPVVLTEADSHLGLTNRHARPVRAARLPGLPDRRARRRRATASPAGRSPPPRAIAARARERLGIARRGDVRARVRRLARRALDQPWRRSRPSRGGAFRVLHVAGSRDYAELAARELPPGYDLREYLDQADFADALAAADLVVARAGGSVFEIAAHGLPAILVPYPHAAGDHQSANARWMSEAGAAIVIADGELTAERLARQVARAARRPPAPGRDGRRLARASRAREAAARGRRASCWCGRDAPDERRRERAVERAAPALRRRRRRRHERLRARRARARRRGERLRRRRRRRTCERLAADGVLQARIGHAADERARRRRRRAHLLLGRARATTPSARPRASAASPSARARSCWPS